MSKFQKMIVQEDECRYSVLPADVNPSDVKTKTPPQRVQISSATYS